MDSHTQYFGPGNQPFHTQDALLAACLYFAGIPFWNPLLPCIHRYNSKILNRLGYSGIPLEEAAQKAFKSGKRGNVEYLFKWPQELRSLIKAFHEEETNITKGEGTAAERLSQIMESKMEPEERLIRIACLVLKMRLQFMRLWESQTPRLRIDNQKEPQTTLDGVKRHAGWKDIPLNASAELKKKMGL
jgi:hypothetical protein